MNICTTLKELKEAGACQPRYRHLCMKLGDVNAWGNETPIPVSLILEYNGEDDTLWSMENCPSLKPLDDDYEAKLKLLDDDYWAKRKLLLRQVIADAEATP